MPLAQAFSFGKTLIKEELSNFEYTIAPGLGLKIINPQGKTKIEGWDQDKISVKIIKRGPEAKLSQIRILKGSGKQKAFIKTSIASSASSRFPLSWFYGTSALKGIEVNYHIKVPRNIAIIIKSNNGEVTVKNMQNLIAIKASCSTVAVHNSTGGLNIVLEKGDITANAVKGPITIQAQKSDIEIRNAGSSVAIDLCEGDIMTNTIQGQVYIKAGKSDIIVDQAQNDVAITISEGNIGLKDIKGSLEVVTAQGDIDVENAQHSSTIKTDNGSITFVKRDKTRKQCAELNAKIS